MSTEIRVFRFGNSFGTTHYSVVDWTDEEVNGKRQDNRPKPIAEFHVSQRHQEVDQRELAQTLMEALNKRRIARDAVKLEELA